MTQICTNTVSNGAAHQTLPQFMILQVDSPQIFIRRLAFEGELMEQKRHGLVSIRIKTK